MKHVYWLLELRIRDEQAMHFEPLVEEMVTAARAEPGILNYEWSTDDERSVCHIHERFLDSDAAIAHLLGFEPFAERFLAVFELRRLAVYGMPSTALREALSAFDPVHFLSPAGGFAR